MLRQIVQRTFRRMGLEVHRRVSDELPYIQSIECGDDRFSFWIANQHTRDWWGRGKVAANAEISALKAMCPAGSIVLDVGAHHGFFTVLFANWAGAQGSVHAFEASSPNALALNANVALNHLSNCTCTLAAVSNENGQVQMNGEAVSSRPSIGRFVPQVTLDSYCEAAGIARVNLVKIDVEGFEGQVLRGSQRLLASRPRIALELHLDDLEQFGESTESVLSLLPREGYQGQIMIRPDWQTLKPWRGRESLPAGGVANIFLWPEA
ncbi:MAG: FkbM family methyltransferase [Planctomycetia bacterium]|nr:FkbM family methyltransferase [Planctomycetia bacterium]